MIALRHSARNTERVGERELLRLAGQLIQRVATLERRMQELEEWLTEVGEDLIDARVQTTEEVK